MRPIIYLLLSIFCLPLLAQKSSRSRSAMDKVAIEKQQEEALFKTLINDMEAAYNEGRYLQVAQYYHDDAIVSGGDNMVEGRDALDNYWEDFFRIGGKWNLTILWERHYDNYVVQRGTSVIMQRNGEKSEVQFFFTGPKKKESGKLPRISTGKSGFRKIRVFNKIGIGEALKKGY